MGRFRSDFTRSKCGFKPTKKAKYPLEEPNIIIYQIQIGFWKIQYFFSTMKIFTEVQIENEKFFSLKFIFLSLFS